MFILMRRGMEFDDNYQNFLLGYFGEPVGTPENKFESFDEAQKVANKLNIKCLKREYRGEHKWSGFFRDRENIIQNYLDDDLEIKSGMPDSYYELLLNSMIDKDKWFYVVEV